MNVYFRAKKVTWNINYGNNWEIKNFLNFYDDWDFHLAQFKMALPCGIYSYEAYSQLYNQF